MFRAVDPVALTTLQGYEHRQLLHRARRYIYIKGVVNAVIALLFLLTFPPELRPRMVAIVLADALFLVPHWFLVRRHPTLATCLSLCITALAISAGDWVGGYQTGASGILYAVLILGGHLVLLKPLSTYLIFGLIAAIYVGTIALEVNGVISINFPFTLSNLLRVVSLNVISMFGLTILTGMTTRLYRDLLQRNKELFALNAVSAVASQSLNLDKVLQLALDKALEAIGMDSGGILLLDPSGGKLVLGAHRGGPPEFFRAISEITTDEGLMPRMMESVLATDDLSEMTEDLQVAMEKEGLKALTSVPLKSQDATLGVMVTSSRSLHIFTSQDLKSLSAIGNQIGMAIENARLYQAERKRAAQLAMVNAVARQAASILDLDQLLHEVVTAIQRSFNYYHVGLFLLDEIASELVMRAIAGGFADMAPPDHRLALGEGMAGWAAETGQPFLANDVSQEPRYVLGILKEALTKAELCVPLKLAGKVTGVLDVQSTQLNAFDETDLMAMETLADQMTVAIENARLFEETKSRFEETTALYQTSLDITAQLAMPELLKSIVERAVTLLKARGGGVCLYDPEQEELRWTIGYGHPEEYVGTALKPREGMAGKVFQTGEPLIVDDYRTWEGRDPLYEAEQPFTALLQIPLKWRDRVIGVLSISDDVQKRTFDQDDVWLATLFANQATVAIENARIYEEEQKRATQLELIGEITQRIASILDLDELLSQVACMIGDTFGYYNTSILLVEAGSDELILKAVAGPLGRTLIDRLRLKIGRNGITGWAAHSGEPLLVNDVSREPKYYLREEAKDTKSELAVPIKLKEEVIGVLDVQSVELDAFSQDDVSILQTLADQLAVAIENARLYQQTDEKLQTRVRELAALYAVAEMVNHSDLDAVLQLALDSAIGVAGMDSGGIMLLDPSTGDLFLRAHRGGSPEFIRVVSQAKADEGLMPRMLNSALTIDDNLSEVTKDRCVAIEKESLQSLVSIPLKSKENPLGVMVIASRSSRTFASQELELLVAIGNQVGVAVDRANLQAQELRAAILEERQDMAWQMHDDIAQTLGYLGLQVDSVMGSPSLAQNVEIQAKLERTRKAIEGAYERVRRSITWLREDVPGHFDLGVALPGIISEFEKQSGCRVESRVDGDQLRLPPSIASQAIYIIREALTNVRRHSGADSVHLTLQGLEGGMVEITIQDNGRGFDLNSGQQSGRRGLGLRFMRERAEWVGGSLRIESGPGQGTRVVVSLPSG